MEDSDVRSRYNKDGISSLRARKKQREMNEDNRTIVEVTSPDNSGLEDIINRQLDIIEHQHLQIDKLISVITNKPEYVVGTGSPNAAEILLKDEIEDFEYKEKDTQRYIDVCINTEGIEAIGTPVPNVVMGNSIEDKKELLKKLKGRQ